MKVKQPVLSISILISGREEMRKCLESLRPFLEELSCELILVDTGCNEEQLAIAREYTDNIFPFTWCNDFAAARNAGLKKARGEWFMFLDDDEWFEDPSEIVSFFKSGEYKKFNGAYYKVRNHVDYSGESYVDQFVTRMVRRMKETCFKGKVHEALSPLYAPVKTFDAHVEHYGYAFATKEERERHSLRNMPLLLEEVEAKPDEMRWYGQIAQEYLATRKYEKGAEISLKGIQRYEERKRADDGQYYIYAALYCYAMVSYLRMDDYAAAEKLLDKGLEKIKGVKPYRAYLLQGAAAVYGEMKRYEDCISASEEYLEIYDKIGTDEKAIAEDGFLITQGTFQEGLNAPLLIRASLVTTIERNYDKLEKFFFRMNWQDPKMMEQQVLEKSIVEAMLDIPYREVFSRMMKTIGERDCGMAELYPVFLEVETECRKHNEDEKLERLWRLVADIESEHFYVLMSRIRCMDKQGNLNGIVETVGKIFAKEESVLDIKEDIWKIMEKNQISPEPFFLNLDFAKWRRVLEKWIYIAPVEEADAWERRSGAWNCREDIRCLLLQIKCKEIRIRQIGLGAGIELLEKLLDKYVEKVLSYYRLFYKEEVFSEMQEALPDEVQLSLKYYKVKEARKSADSREAIRAIRDMIDTYPVLEEAVLQYAKLLRDKVESENREAENAKRELRTLVSSLKTTAKLRIERKEYQTAKEILLQVQNCVPEDEEVRELLKKISGDE